MAQKAGLLKEYQQNFVLDEGKIRKLAAAFEQFASKLPPAHYVRYYVELNNNSFYETKDLEEVLADPNSAGRAIQALGITIEKQESTEGDDQEADATASLGFRCDKTDRVKWGVSYTDRDWCFLLADELDAQVKRSLRKRPFWLVARRYIDMILLFLVFAIASAALASALSSMPPEFTSAQIAAMSQQERLAAVLALLVRTRSVSAFWTLPITFVMVAIFILVTEFRPIGRLLEGLDRSVFYWGDAIKEWDAFTNRISLVKWGIIIAFVVSLLASLIAGIMQS